MVKAFNISELTAEYLISKFKDNDSLEIHYYSHSQGSGRDSIHKNYYMEIGLYGDTFSDEGKFKTAYAFVGHINNILDSMEEELRKENIHIIKSRNWFENGYDYRWNSRKTDEIVCATKMLKIVPSKSFYDLQGWLQKKADFKLGAFDIYSCSICQKRMSNTYDSFTYYCKYNKFIADYLTELKNAYKQGYKVVAKICENETFEYDYNKYSEYEQYGRKTSYLEVTTTTNSGRKPKTFTLVY